MQSSGVFERPIIWQIAKTEQCLDYEWHFRYSLRSTEILGKLACLVLSKILGIGSTERHWKDVKQVQSQYRCRLNAENIKKESTIVGMYCAERGEIRRKSQARAGKLWEENDFESLGLDKFGVDVERLTAPTKEPTRIVRAWKETWETKLLSKRNEIYEARLLRKYGGLKWRDPDNNNAIVTADPKCMYYWKEKRGVAPDYFVAGMLSGYDKSAQFDEMDDKTWDLWARNEDLFECIMNYYAENPDESIVVYEEGDDASSESDSGED